MLSLFYSFSFSQQNRYWTANAENKASIVTDKAVARQSYPKDIKLFNLNTEALRKELFSIVGNNASGRSTIISLPNASGQIEEFEVYEASNFSPALQAQFPEIRAYSGQGITNRGAILKLSISPQGVQTMLFRAGAATEYIEPYSKDHSVYSVFESNRQRGSSPWTCSTPDEKLAKGLNSLAGSTNKETSSTGELKVLRLAQSVTAEYSNYFGATSAAQVSLVLAAVNATLTRCNGCYEKDLALHLNLIANTTSVFYYNAATDPYSDAATGASGAWNGELQATLTAVIGDANYDIGHLFGASGGGGNAGCIGCVCNAGKGSGFTSPADGIPQGDNFDIDYVVHEVGHQLGANHTFSNGAENSGNNKEVGSGITIMGYAGITAQDVAPHSIDIFHETSIGQIQANLATKTCPVTTVITPNNATPVVAAVSNYTIPKSTPFALTGSATDANAADVLTYCWEQNDNSTTNGAASVASPTKATGPNWLSFKPTISPTRTFPILATILAGNFVTGPLPGGDAGTNIEALSSVARTLNFRLTVRDNAPYIPAVKVGQTAFTDMVVTVDGASGPFMVTIPNTNLTWLSGSTQTITWDVASSDLAPVSCANVKISLSTDGGLTFPTVLLASTPNDGTQAVTLPNISTASARIKIESVGNIFFDISNTNFVISTSAMDFAFSTPATTNLVCGSATSSPTTLSTSSVGGYVVPIALTASGNPAGTTVTFGTNPLVPGNTSVLTLNGINNVAPGTYTITVTGTSGANVHTVPVTYTITPGAGPAISAQPTSHVVCVGSADALTVTSATATSFQWQQSADGGITWTAISGATGASYSFTSSTAQNGILYRCVCSTVCGSTNSNTATLTVVSASVGGTLSPAALTVCGPVNSTVLTLSGNVGAVIQWEYSTDGGVTFPNVVANTTNTLTVTNIAANRIYRVRVQGVGCTAVNSTTATLTYVASSVGPLQISADVGTTICTGDPTLLTVVGANTFGNTSPITINAIGTANPYPAILSVNGIPTSGVAVESVTISNFGHTFPADVDVVLQSPTGQNVVLMSDIGGLFTTNMNVTYTFKDGSPAMGTAILNPSGTYRPTNSGGTDAWVAPGPGSITQANPLLSTFTGDFNGQWKLFVVDDVTGDGGAITGGFSIKFNNTVAPVPGLTYAWTPATGLSNTTTNPTAASPMTTTTYNVIGTNAAGCTSAASITINVNTRPAITTQPVAKSVCEGSDAVFTVAATGTNVTYQWQVSTDNCATYSNISGATSATLTVPAVTAALNNNSYRVVVSGTCPIPVNSNCVKLTVLALPPLSVTPNATCGGVAGSNGVALTTGGQTSPPPIHGTATFTSNTVVPIPDFTAAGATSSLTAAGIPANATVTAMSVKWNLAHPWNGDMVIALKAPNGNVLNLDYYLTNTGGTGATTGFVNTVVSSAGVNSLSSGSGTYTGIFKADAAPFASASPIAPTGFATAATTVTAFSGLYSTLNGTYTLGMYDGGNGDAGTLTNWSLTIDYTTPDPATPPITYIWSPAAGLYTNTTATTAYTSGTLTPTVYAAPTVYTAYTVTANATANGCKATATALVNYTPPAPTVVPNPAVKCATDPPLKLKSSSSTTTTKTFSSGPINNVIPDGNPVGITNSITVSGIPATATVIKMDVKINATHGWAGDMIIALKNPNGTINLDYGLSATGGATATTGFVNTIISSAGGAPLSSGSGTFTGTFAADKAPGTNNPYPAPSSMAITTTNFNDLFTPISGINGQYTLGVYDFAAPDEGTLVNWSIDITYFEGVRANPAVWSPVAGLFTNAAGTVPYVAGTAVDSVYANPAATATYDVNIAGFAGAVGPSVAIPSNLPNENGFSLVTFNFRNSNAYPVVITDVASLFSIPGDPANTAVYYRKSAISSTNTPGAISPANGWLTGGTGTPFEIPGIQPFVTGMSIEVPPGATYGIAVEGYDAFGGNLAYSGTGANPTPATTFTVAGCSIITGPGIGFGGDIAPTVPANTPRGFIGSVSFAPAGSCISPARKVTVTVNTPLAIVTQPVSVTACEGGSATFTDVVTGSAPSHNWQLSTNNGATFTNLTNGTGYSGVNTATFTVNNITNSMDTYTYRDSIGGANICAAAISNYVNLKVTPKPTVTIAAPVNRSLRLIPGSVTGSATIVLTASSNPQVSAVNGYTWYRNGVIIPGATSNQYVVDIDHLGDYTASGITSNGCGSAGVSNLITISDSASGRVFIYPNPNDGRFQVRYNSVLGNVNLPRGINVYDARGKRVLTQSYLIAAPFARMDVDLRPYGSGVYWLELVDMSGNRLAVGRAEVLK